LTVQLNQKLKISLVVSDLSSKGSGRWGGAVRPFLLAQALQLLGHRVELVGVAYHQGEDKIASIDSDLPIFAYPCGYQAGFFRAASRVVQQIDGDIIYAVKPKTSSFGLALLKKKLVDRPLILDIDDWELSWYGGDQPRQPLKPLSVIKDLLKADGALRYPDHPLYLHWLENLVDRANCITTHTSFLQKRFGGIYLPNGKDTSLFNPDGYDADRSREKYGLQDYKILMFPGAPRPYKGVEDVLAALDQLNDPRLRLAIVGGSPYDDYDRQLQERWGNWIIEIPKVPVQQMPEIVAAAHIVVVPQRDTPAAQAQFPLKLTDAMAMAKPILATRVGDLPEILGDTGFLVDASSPEQIAAAIENIFADWEVATAKAKRGRQRCMEHYSIETMADILDRTLATL
jgi:glycosyltransferase involved in cell wall biosynthesis